METGGPIPVAMDQVLGSDLHLAEPLVAETAPETILEQVLKEAVHEALPTMETVEEETAIPYVLIISTAILGLVFVYILVKLRRRAQKLQAPLVADAILEEKEEVVHEVEVAAEAVVMATPVDAATDEAPGAVVEEIEEVVPEVDVAAEAVPIVAAAEPEVHIVPTIESAVRAMLAEEVAEEDADSVTEEVTQEVTQEVTEEVESLSSEEVTCVDPVTEEVTEEVPEEVTECDDDVVTMEEVTMTTTTIITTTTEEPSNRVQHSA